MIAIKKTKKVSVGDRLIILPDVAAAKTKEGLFIPDSAREKPQTGIVLAVGEEESEDGIQVGDKVYYGKHAGSPILYDNKECLTMRKSDIYLYER